MHFVLQTPSLQHLAGVKLVAHLWSQPDICTQIRQLCNDRPGDKLYRRSSEWTAIEEKVKSFKVWSLPTSTPLAHLWTSRDIFTQNAGFAGYNMRQNTNCTEVEEAVKSSISALPLPKQCKKQLLDFVRPLGVELLAWCRYHNEDKINFQFVADLLPQQVRWTMHGIIDYAEAAQLMVKDESFDIERRYEIACINCLEDEARQLFQRMGEDRKQEYVMRVRNRNGEHYQKLVLFFTCNFMDDAAFLDNYWRSRKSFHQCLFEESLYIGNRATCEYLFSKFNQREKEQVVDECQLPSLNRRRACFSGNGYSMGSVLYFFSLMNEEQREQVLRKNVRHLLGGLLRWPMQTLFAEAAECGWQLMDDRARTGVLYDIVVFISQGLTDYDYAQLFWGCWRLSSAGFKQGFLDDMYRLEELFATKDEEFIQLVLNEAPLYRLKELVEPNYYGRCVVLLDEPVVLMDENVISEAALMACKNSAELIRSNEPEDVEKRLRSQYVCRLVDRVIERRRSKR